MLLTLQQGRCHIAATRQQRRRTDDAAGAALAAAQQRRRMAPRCRSSGGGGSSSSGGANVDTLTHLLESQRRRMEVRRDMYNAKREVQAATEQDRQQWWEVDLPPNMLNPPDAAALDAALSEAAARGALAVVSYFAPDCYACRALQPKLRQIARERADRGVVFIKVNGGGDSDSGGGGGSSLRDYMAAAGIDKVPYFQLFRGKAVVAEFAASMSPEKLRLLREQIDVYSAAGSDDGGSGGGGGGFDRSSGSRAHTAQR